MKRFYLIIILLLFYISSCKKEHLPEDKQLDRGTKKEVIKEQEESNQTVPAIVESSPETVEEEYRRIDAEAGLRMRDKPGVDGEKIVTIPYRSRVTLLKELEEELTISEATGRWSRVKWKEYEGWVFGGFLTKAQLPMEAVLTKIDKMDIIFENRVVFYTKDESGDENSYTIYSCNDTGEDLKEVYSFSEKFNIRISLFNKAYGIIKITKVDNNWPDSYYYYDLFIDLNGKVVGKVEHDSSKSDRLAYSYSRTGRYKAAYIPFDTEVSDFSQTEVVITDELLGEVAYVFEYKLDGDSIFSLSDWSYDDTIFIQAVGGPYTDKRAILFKVDPVNKKTTTYDIAFSVAELDTFVNDGLKIYPESKIALGDNYDRSTFFNEGQPGDLSVIQHFLFDLTGEDRRIVPKFIELTRGGFIHNSYIFDDKSLVYLRDLEEDELVIHNIKTDNVKDISDLTLSILENSLWYGWFISTFGNSFSIIYPDSGKKYTIPAPSTGKYNLVGIAEYCPAMVLMEGLH